MTDLHNSLKILSERLPNIVGDLQTEEATKTALVLPFIRGLGYDFTNPKEVIPEFNADVGNKKGERVDYCICHGDKPTILIECKTAGTDLDGSGGWNQLFRYFSVTEARLAILTDGIRYRFYSDLEEPNKLDLSPFLILDLGNLDETSTHEALRLTKDNFNLEEMLPAARELKYVRAFKSLLAMEIRSPSEDMTRFLSKQVYSGVLNANRISQFQPLVAKAFQEFIREEINERISIAFGSNEVVSPEGSTVANGNSDSDGEKGQESVKIITTEEELLAYSIVRGILSEHVDPERITPKDTQSYFNVLLDNNTWKVICRFYFGARSKKVVVFDEEQTSFEIEKITDIYKYRELLITAYKRREAKNQQES